ncbi:hypothetical protein [Agromyces marinus]|uniref:DUF4232 domain-containing protein n=1 Tax=Agromyces marinus TaxID=1389020 RepID=A0ABM8H0I2_9MICO|nr:hypothetical protein [Agromyces marinus]UIP57612.1 hypothetical protein DSM26151_04770 [Agromyces marinus]BDZ54236.1 hypothetical protein GCM10025870_13090 [Agromyces marinus]
MATSGRRRRAAGSTVIGGLGIALTTGCVGVNLTACPAIGYLQSLEIVLAGPGADEVERLVLCGDRGCSVPGVDATPVPPTGPLWVANELPGDRWRVDLDLDAPERISIELLDAAGNTLDREDFDLEWVRVGGSERCGGPMHTDPIEIEVPAAR